MMDTYKYSPTAGTPTLQCNISNPVTVLIGEPFPITINCTNSGNSVGYYPFVDVFVYGDDTTQLNVVDTLINEQSNPFIAVSFSFLINYTHLHISLFFFFFLQFQSATPINQNTKSILCLQHPLSFLSFYH